MSEDVIANLPARIQAALTQDTRALLTRAAEAASGADWQLYLVAGVLRDRLLGLEVRDLDISVVGDALRIAEEISGSDAVELEAFAHFGTATRRRAGDIDIDLLTARKESYPQPGALPVVEAGDIYDDLARRDFSII